MDAASAMASALSDLRGQLAAARAKVESTFLFAGTASVRLRLDTVAKWLDFLDSAQADVLAGSRTYDWWASSAQDQHDELAAAVGFTDKWSAPTVASDIAHDVATNVAVGAGGFVLVVALVVGLLLAGELKGIARAVSR